MKSYLSIVAGLVLSLSMFSCGKSDITVLKLAHGLSPSHSVHQAMEFMAERLKEKSNGQMIIQIYASGQLGSEPQCLELLQIGGLDITKVSAAVMEGFVEEYKVTGLPYIFRDKEHAFRVLDGDIGRQLLDAGKNYWLKGLCFYDSGARSFYTKKPINEPADLRGQKIRVMASITANNMVRALGGSPTPISWGELYTALQSGVVDGAENNPPSFYLSHHYEVCNYYSLDEHTIIPDVVLISTHAWNRLTEQERIWLQEAADESVPYQRELWEESERMSLEAVEKAGVTIIYPDKEPFVQAVQPLFESYKNNEKIYSLIQRIRDKE
jgi:tripartite ATP-independent transporter DctP family solute receptor